MVVTTPSLIVFDVDAVNWVDGLVSAIEVSCQSEPAEYERTGQQPPGL
jgi:hypothetical protein